MDSMENDNLRLQHLGEAFSQYARTHLEILRKEPLNKIAARNLDDSILAALFEPQEPPKQRPE